MYVSVDRFFKNVMVYLPSYEMNGYLRKPMRMSSTSPWQLERKLLDLGHQYAARASAVPVYVGGPCQPSHTQSRDPCPI